MSFLPFWIRIRIPNTDPDSEYGSGSTHLIESGSATLGLTCISICVAAGGRSLHMLKKARRNWRWRPAQPLLLCVITHFCSPGSGSGSATLDLICITIPVAAGGRSLHMLKKARRNWRWRPAQPVAADPRHWWRFTIHSVLDVVHRTRYGTGSAQRTVRTKITKCL